MSGFRVGMRVGRRGFVSAPAGAAAPFAVALLALYVLAVLVWVGALVVWAVAVAVWKGGQALVRLAGRRKAGW